MGDTLLHDNGWVFCSSGGNLYYGPKIITRDDDMIDQVNAE